MSSSVQRAPFLVGEHFRPHIPWSARRVARSAYKGLAWTARYRIRLLITDTLVVAAAMMASVLISGIAPDAILLSLVFGALWTVSLEGYRTRGSRVVGIGSSEYKRIFGASLLPFAGMAMFAVITDTSGVREFFLIGFPLGTLTLVLSRWLWRQWLVAQRERGHYLSRALVLGPAADVVNVAGRMAKGSGAAYTVIGAVIQDYTVGSIDVGSRSIPVLTGDDDIAATVRAIGADIVVVAGQQSVDDRFVRKLGWQLEQTSAELVLA